MPERRIDEILEQLWIAEEKEQKATRAGLLDHHKNPFDQHVYAKMEHEDLILPTGDTITLTQQGRRRAAEIIRRHRLAERLMRDVLEMREPATESAACQLEHMLSVEAMESICTLLGHPKKCPHGHAVPPGRCCARASHEARPVVTTLTKMQPGKEGTVAYIATHHHHRLDKLAAYGLLPGVRIRLHQRHPSFVIQMGETTIAIDEETAGDIYVRPKWEVS